MEEIWKDIEGYEGYYQVSNLGRVKSLDRVVSRLNRWGQESTLTIKGRVLVPKDNGTGYKIVGLQKQNKPTFHLIHRLVAQAFIPNPDNLSYINHKDENKLNNYVDNLEWCTAKYNCNYGTHNERCQATKNRKGIRGCEIPINQYTLEGDYITTYKSSHEAARQINVKYQGGIISCCKGICPTAYGYVWKYKEII